MKILITGIGNIGKSTLREKVALTYPDKVLQIDMDYYNHDDIPQSSTTVIVVEDVHGLESNPEQYDRIIYLMPPPIHIILWLRRAWAWFSSGIVDLSNPQGVNKRYALSNIPLILKIVSRNILFSKQWINNDMKIIKGVLQDKTIIVKKVDQGFEEIRKLFIELNSQ